MWPFTGGCHYSGDCLQYRQSCQHCPKVKDLIGAPALTSWVHSRKRKRWDNKPLLAVTPSAWMKEKALSSSLFAEASVTHIRNCVDPRIFNGQARHKMRAELGLLPARWSSSPLPISHAREHLSYQMLSDIYAIRRRRAVGAFSSWVACRPTWSRAKMW
jgi:hypothetical protein